MTAQQSRHVDPRLIAWLAISAASVLVVGLVLIWAGSNEAFTSTDPVVQDFWGVITQAGDELFFIVVISFLYFGADKFFGKRLLYGFLISIQVNALGKAMFKDPRPMQGRDADYAYHEEGYGFPSGHTQSSVAFWGYSIAATRGRTYSLTVKILGTAMLVLVPISRLVLGVHDVQDVTGGFVIGIVVLLAYLLVEEQVMPRIQLDWIARISLGVAAWMSIWVMSIVALPDSAGDFGQPCGLLVGVAVGIPLEETRIKFDPALLPTNKRVVSGIVGCVLTIATYLALSFVFGGIATDLHVWRFFRYLILGLVVTLVFTWVLKKILMK